MLPPIFETQRFVLKPYEPSDEDRLVETGLDPVSTRFMGGSTGDEQEERAFFRSIFNLYDRKEDRWFWVWGIYRNDLLCGHLELKETSNTNENELEVVYMIHPDERRKGVMTEVLSFLKSKQKEWGKRIIATVGKENVDSISLLEKWGIDKKEIMIDKETGEESLKLLLSE